jgi:hypothetical protein
MPSEPVKPRASVHALTLYQPDAWLVVEGHRRLINTKWRPPRELIGGFLAIHVALRPERGELRKFEARTAHMRRELGCDIPPAHRMPWGAIIGMVKVSGLLEAEPPAEELRRWWKGPLGWVVDEPVPVLPPIPCTGTKVLWSVPETMLTVLRERYRNGRAHLQRQAERQRRQLEDDDERLAMMDESTH